MMVFAGSALLLATAAAAQVPLPPAAAPGALTGRSSAYYHFSLGQQARMAGHLDEALEEYRKAQKDDPGSGPIRAEVARLLRENGKLKEAIQEAQEGVKVDARSPEVRLTLAQLYLAQAEADQSAEPMKLAAQSYEAALKLEPKHADAHIAMGAYHAEIIDKVGALVGGLTYGANKDKGEEHFRKALKLAPDSPIAHIEMANGMVMMHGKKMVEEAAKLYSKAAEMEPRDAMERLDVEAARAEID